MATRLTFVLALLGSSTVLAQGPAPDPSPQPPEAKPLTIEEQVVVSASRVEQGLVNAPATVSVVTAETIQNAPSVNFGDLLRAVPGVNVTQVSAREVNITTRGQCECRSVSRGVFGELQ